MFYQEPKEQRNTIRALDNHALEQWFSTFIPPGRTMVQVQVSRAAHMSFTYYVINSNQPDL